MVRLEQSFNSFLVVSLLQLQLYLKKNVTFNSFLVVSNSTWSEALSLNSPAFQFFLSCFAKLRELRYSDIQVSSFNSFLVVSVKQFARIIPTAPVLSILSQLFQYNLCLHLFRLMIYLSILSQLFLVWYKYSSDK